MYSDPLKAEYHDDARLFLLFHGLLTMELSRRLLWLIAVLCFGAIGVALVSQYYFDMLPCAWCVLQRLIFLVIGVVALIGANARSLVRLCSIVCALFGISGIAAAWYQYDVAAHMFSCDLTFADQFMSATGLEANIPWLFGIYASCMDAMVDVFGVEYALWSLALFAVVVVMSVLGVFSRRA